MQNIQKEASSLYGPIRKAVRKIISETITDGAMKRILKQYEGPDGNGTLVSDLKLFFKITLTLMLNPHSF